MEQLQLRPGDDVRVRRQRWTVATVRDFDGCRLLTLAGTGGSNAGDVRHFLTPFDTVDVSPESNGVGRHASLRTWRASCSNALNRGGAWPTFQTAAQARIDLLPYQLEPALALMSGLGSRVLLADDVGLGKTVQAGLAIAELKARGAAERVLIVTPSSLRHQWAEQLLTRFGLDATVIDMAGTRRLRALLPLGMNPWASVSLAIASVDFIKRAEILPGALACHWDMVVIDEAHGLAQGTDREIALSAFCTRAPYVLLLTATPHNGDQRAFVSLCELGAIGADPILVFRRTRRETAIGPERRIHRLMVRPSSHERRVHTLLTELTQIIRARPGGVDQHAWLALSVLYKRAFSSAFALEQSVRRRLAAMAERPDQLVSEPDEQQLLLPLVEDGGELNGADEPPGQQTPLLDDRVREHTLLMALAEAAALASSQESKLARLRRLVVTLRRRGEPVIVFTEYRDTLLHLRNVIGTPATILHGGLTPRERLDALAAFTSGRQPILLATDAAGEGLNLQAQCRCIINLELPWNPMRLEQRIGRVDRIGQRRRVHVVHLVGRGTRETGILGRLDDRVKQARADIGAANPLGTDAWHDNDRIGEADIRLTVLGKIDAADPPVEAPGLSTRDDDDSPLLNQLARVARFTRLTEEAALEAGRIGAVRARLQSRSVTAASRGRRIPLLSGSSILLARARSRRWRTFLAGRLLVLFETRCDDGLGRTIASHLTPLAIHSSAMSANGVLRSLAKQQPVSIEQLNHFDSSLAIWRERTMQQHQTFTATRLIREQGIAATSNDDDAEFQPGLFDRRAHRHQALLVEEGREWLAASVRRQEAAAAAATLVFSTGPILMLCTESVPMREPA